MVKRSFFFFESVVMVAIVLVLIQTFVEDLAILMDLTWSVRRILIFTGFAFDLFFTIEFLARLYTAVYRGTVADYLFKQRGWIDFAASIPLLLLSSGPAVLTLVSGGALVFGVGSILNVLKVVKAIRIARVLRLLRVLKIFKQLKYAESPMAQRHISIVTSICISTIVLVLFAFSVMAPAIGLPTNETVFSEKRADAIELADSAVGPDGIDAAALAAVTESVDELLIVKVDGVTEYSRFTNAEYSEAYGPTDFEYMISGDVEYFFSMKPLMRIQAATNITYFSAVVILILVILLYYSPHFALTVSDPIHVMRRGMDEPNYNFEVRIPDEYSEDDVFVLADSYNKIYLPLKDRSGIEHEGQASLLSIDDVDDILSE